MSSQRRCLSLFGARSPVPRPHAHVPHLNPGGVAHDSVHDRVGMDASAEPGVPVLLLELRTEDGGAFLEAPFHYLGSCPHEGLRRADEAEADAPAYLAPTPITAASAPTTI